MSTIQLMGGPASPFTRKARIVLEEKGIAYKMVKANPVGEDNPVIPLNPLGKVPVLLVDGSQTLYDSSVIVEYLDTLQPEPALLPPVSMARVAVKRWESLGDGICDAGFSWRVESRREANRNTAFMQRQVNKIRRGMAAASAELGNRPWCHGESFSLADIAIGTALGWLDFRMPDYDWRQPFPNLDALNRRLLVRRSFQVSMPEAD